MVEIVVCVRRAVKEQNYGGVAEGNKLAEGESEGARHVLGRKRKQYDPEACGRLATKKRLSEGGRVVRRSVARSFRRGEANHRAEWVEIAEARGRVAFYARSVPYEEWLFTIEITAG